MADLAKIKRNVAKMAEMGAPESDIDGYITSEGTSVEAIKDFKPGMDIQGAIKSGVSGAAEPILGPLGMGKMAREAQGMYGAGREAILESNMPIVGKQARSRFSQEGPTLTIPQTRISPKTDLKFSPQNITKQAQGLGVDIATGLGGDLIASRGPALLNRAVAKPLSNTLEGVGSRAMNILAKPSKQAMKYANPGRGLAKYVGPRLSKEGLRSGAEEQIGKLTTELQKLASSPEAKPVDVTPVFEQIKASVDQLNALPETYAPQIQAHRELASDLANLARSKGKIGSDGRMYLDPKDAIEMKRIIGRIPSWNVMDPKLGSLSKVTRKAYGALDQSIDKSVPGSKAVNQGLSDLIGAERSLSDVISSGQKSNPINISPFDVMAGGGMSYAMGPEAGVPTYLGLKAAIAASKSTPVLSTVGGVAGGLSRGVESAGVGLEKLNRPSIVEQIPSAVFSRMKDQPKVSTALRMKKGK